MPADPANPWADARCSLSAVELGEALPGSAPTTSGWLLVEHDGPWGRAGFPDSGLPESVVTEVASRAATAGVRIQLIRRHGRRDPAIAASTAFLVRAVPGSSWARRFRVPTPADLARLPLEAVTSASPPADGEDVPGTIHLVCTHGRRDACCAQWGRATAAAMAAAAGDSVWETTHTGGHRFAANVVVLPSGHVYGRVGPEDAPGLVAAHAAGRVVPALLRGRACDPMWGQVADVATRERLDLTAVDDVAVEQTLMDGDRAVVVLRAGGESLRVHLHRHETGQERPFTCGDDALRDPGRVEVVQVEGAQAAPAP